MSTRSALLAFLQQLQAPPYPARVFPFQPLSVLSLPIQPDASPLCLAGRVLQRSARSLLLADASGQSWISVGETLAAEQSIEPVPGPHRRAEGAPEPGFPHFVPADQLLPLLEPGDLVQATTRVCGSSYVLESLAVLAPALREPSIHPDHPGGGASIHFLPRRARVIQLIRSFFVDQGFLEAETPIMSCYSGLEPHLDPFESRFRSVPTVEGTPVYLLTSPEYALKRLLVAGVEKTFQISKVFRNGEVGAFHNPEFSMLEWYRAYSDYRSIMEDLEQLVLYLAERLGLERTLTWQGRRVDLTPPWPRLTVREAFLERLGIDLALATDASTLRRLALERGIALPSDESWEDSYFRLLIDHIEPQLGLNRPTFLIDYPAPFAALARVRAEAFPVAERFELYLAGVEVGNAYSELNDPELQRARFQEEQAQRKAAGAPVFEPDRDYLEALERGLPPTGGIAVGVDRLVMLLLDLPDVRSTLAFPFPLQPGHR